MKYKYKKYKRKTALTALFLALLMVMQTSFPLAAAAQTKAYDEYEHNITNITDENSAEDEYPDCGYMENTEDMPDPNVCVTTDELPRVFEDGYILIYNYSQLLAIGSGRTVTDADGSLNGVGSGSIITDSEGCSLTYSLDASYRIVRDIVLPRHTLWQLPNSFTGRVVPKYGSEKHELYDDLSDTIYIYNRYQLAAMALDSADSEPVLSGDDNTGTFGTGTLIRTDDGGYLTYTGEHNYAISAAFSSDTHNASAAVVKRKKNIAASGVQNPQSDGRDFAGQVVKTIDSKNYILIGNEEQLRAIGTNADVLSPVYEMDLVGTNYVVDTSTATHGLLYGGDADLLQSHNGEKTYSFQRIYNTNSYAGHKRYYAGVDQSTGQVYTDAAHVTSDKNSTMQASWKTGEKYSIDSNYIIFRDIDLGGQNDPWTPLMFTGTMYGAKSVNGEALWDGSTITDSAVITADTAANRPVIDGVYIVQDTPIIVDRYIGIGFFATISNKTSSSRTSLNNGSLIRGTLSSSGTAVVKNISLHGVHVENNASAAEVNDTMISSLLSGVGEGVGLLLDGLLAILSFGEINPNTNKMLKNLLNARTTDPTVFASGAFAGRICGDVLVENCDVDTVTVENVMNYTGGFVGYSEGTARYDLLSNTVGALVSGLSALLNLIPAIGLGDLIEILLGQQGVLNIGNLIVTGYYNPRIIGCEISGLTGNIGNTTTSGQAVFAESDFIGGFIGSQIGAQITDCRVTNSTYHVYAKNYGGGFGGLARDAEIKGTLDTSVGIDLAQTLLSLQPQSILTDCTISSCSYDVSGCCCLGGFEGAMANSYAIDCTISCPAYPLAINASAQYDSVSGKLVKGSGGYAGGFVGYMTAGWAASLGQDETNNQNLVGMLVNVVKQLLQNDPSIGQKLLTLRGSSPSAALGCRIFSQSLTVHADITFAGGFVGRGEGAYIARSDSEAFTDLSKWSSVGIKTGQQIQNNPIVIEYLSSVAAVSEHTSGGNTTISGDCAGGAAGYISSVAFQGLLNETLGLGNFIKFEVRDVIVNAGSAGFTVQTGKDNAGGGFGFASGGDIINTDLNGLLRVQANNRAAGFAAIAGPGDMAGSTGGLTVNLLGLNNVLSVKSLLSLGELVEVNIINSDVTGINTGFTVEAVGTGSRENSASESIKAAGYIADSNSTKIINSHVSRLLSVISSDENGCAGGFAGTSATGGLAEVVGDKTTEVSTLIQANGLVSAVKYLIPEYIDCTVTFIDGGFVDADIAGGFVGDMESGTVDNGVTRINLTDKKDEDMLDGDWTIIDTSPWTRMTKEIFDPGNPDGENTYGAVNPSGNIDKQFAVFNIDHVSGRTYAGGFGGKLRSGALAKTGGGISVLSGFSNLDINLKDILDLVEAYVPSVTSAGVYSVGNDDLGGFTVSARDVISTDICSGSAGGFAGFMAGAQISYCDVYQLGHTVVTAPKDLEAHDAPSYFNSQSAYAVAGGHYAGGYVGNMDVGSAASLGEGLKILGIAISLADALKAFNVVISTVEHSDVRGAPGGFSVISDGTIRTVNVSGSQGQNDPTEPDEPDEPGPTNPDAAAPLDRRVGRAGGYAGGIYGGHIQNSHCINFYYIIGIEEAGGYVGNMQPGSAANVLGEGSLIGKLVNIEGSLATAVESFVPTIRNSTTSCVPCGGVVRAHSPSDSGHQRGCAGGYCGHSEGGHIWGLNNDPWKSETEYNGEMHICTAWRIRSVYGYEYAGGFTGCMESADTADTGNISLLGGLVSISDPVSALKVVYPTEIHTAVYGPLRNIDLTTWNCWVQYVGSKGAYMKELEDLVQQGTITTQAQLNNVIKQYIYGMTVIAGRRDHVAGLVTEGGIAGGYVGFMVTGAVTDGQTYDIKLVQSMRSAGGYAGRMQTGGAADFGSVNLLGLTADLGALVKVLKVFVPRVASGSVHGYRSGLTVICTGLSQNPTGSSGTLADNNSKYSCGCAGGYAGSVYGAQIWGDENDTGCVGSGCNVSNLRFVRGVNAAGGFVGISSAAAVADVSTNISNGFLQGILSSVINTPGSLASVLKATAATMRDVAVSPDSSSYGFIVEGYGGAAPRFAGGFAGTLEATVINDLTHPYTAAVSGLRTVDARYYAGGFVGLADVGSVASISDSDLSGSSSTTILGLINAGGINVLDIFKTYIYDSSVTGVGEGFVVQAHESGAEGLLGESRRSGCAGGFGGGVLLGTVERSSVTNLNAVSGVNYTGGFIGHAGKSGVLDADSASAANLLGATVGVLDIFGTQTDDCDVSGIPDGFTVSSRGGSDPIAGGFVGYADISHITNSTSNDRNYANNLKLVQSDGIAGGFVGKTDRHFLIELEASSPVVQAVLGILNVLLKILQLYPLQNLDLINTDSWLSNVPNVSNLLGLKLLSDGELLYVNLLGLRVGVSLGAPASGGSTNVAIITIGDSSVELPYDQNGIDWNSENSEAVVNLIKGSRTKLDKCTVTGIPYGYDVYGGGSGVFSDALNDNGCAGGFVGYNIEGRITSSTMVYCDVVRGTSHKTGPFSGVTDLQSVYSFNNLKSIEQVTGEENHYSVYREYNATLTYILTSNNVPIGSTSVQDTPSGANITYNRYDIVHLASPLIPDGTNDDYHTGYDKWKGAVMATDASGVGAVPVKVFETDAKAVLMRDTANLPNEASLTTSPSEMQDPCKYVKLTIQKVWDDMNDADNLRPSSLTFRITQHTVDENGDPILDTGGQPIVSYPTADMIPDIDQNGCITLTAANDSVAGSSVWERVIEGLPVQAEGDNNTVICYNYTVEEVSVPAGYSSSTAGSSGYTYKFTNTHRPTLPVTGAGGDLMMTLLGVTIVIFGVLTFGNKKKTSKSKASVVFRPPRASPQY